MTLFSIASLAAAMFVLAASPGPGVFATVSRSLASGFFQAFAVILGIVTGDVVFLLFAVFGMSFIAKAMGGFFVLIRIAGGLYLIYTGIRIWRSSPDTFNTVEARKGKGYGNYMAGLLITLSNPKVILFYCTFLPTFIDLAGLGMVDILIVALVVSSVLGVVLTVYAYLADRARTLFSSRLSIKRLNRTAGSVMVATGVAIAAKS